MKTTLKAGDQLTVKNDIIDISGNIIHDKGSKVTVRDVQSTPGHWSRICPDIYNPEKIYSVRLIGHYGHYNLGTFLETNNL